MSKVDNQPVSESLDGLPIITGTITIEGHQAIVERSSASAISQFRIFAVATGGTGNIYPNVAVDNATSLTVNAVIKPPDISLPNPFAICVTGPSFPLPNCQNLGSQFTYTVTWYNLKPGTYTVTEPDSGLFSDVTGVPATLAVPLGSARTITATHTLRFRLFLPLVAMARS